MKSDPHFYKIFKACPELFAVFAAIDPKAAYTFGSKAFKVDRTCDGVFESKDPRAPTWEICPRNTRNTRNKEGTRK